jgi:formylglycine-generating enzyme
MMGVSKRIWTAAALALLTGTLGCDPTSQMVKVEPSSEVGTTKAFYIDKYEATVKKKNKRLKNGTLTQITVADSRPNVIPETGVSAQDARDYCENADKRLCTTKEWITACKGPNGFRSGVQTSPKDPVSIDTLCVVNKKATYNASTGESGNTTAKTASNVRCVTSGIAVYDMVGNVSEWASDWLDNENYSVAMGANSRSTVSQSICNFAVDAEYDDPDQDDVTGYVPSNTRIGFRCCKDVDE